MLREEKLKVALDTNSIIKYFERLLKFRRGRDNKFSVPSECLFLKNNNDRIDLFISILNQAEIFRKLKSEWGCSDYEIEDMWKEFVQWLPLKIIEEITIRKEVVSVTVQLPLKKKTIVNFIHLLVAKEYDLWFYTGDKEIVEKGKGFYSKIITYDKLKDLIEDDYKRDSTGENQPVILLIILSSLGPMLFKNSCVDITLSGTSTLTFLLFNIMVFAFISFMQQSQLFKTFGKNEVDPTLNLC